MTTENSGTSERERTKRLEQLQQEHQTELLIGSAPCISFRTLLHPSEIGTKQQSEKVQDEERQCVHQSVQETVEHGSTFLARTPIASVELVHARDARISQDTLGVGSDVSLAHGCDRRWT